MKTGSIVSWTEEKGIGSIKSDNSNEELFFHISELRGFVTQKFIGRTVRFQVDQTQEGVRSAVNISIIRNPTTRRIKFGIYTFLLLLAPCLVVVLGFMREFYIPIVLYVIAIPLTYFAYKTDRRRAKNGARRIPEPVLHLLEFLGGWYGGFYAQKKLYHKIRKKTFQRIFWLIVITHQAVSVFYIWVSAPGEFIPQKELNYVEEWEQNKTKKKFSTKKNSSGKQANPNRKRKPKPKPKKAWYDFY